jgi:plastocyanin
MSPQLRRSLNRMVALLGAALIIATGVLLVACGPQGGDKGDGSAVRAAPAAGVERVEITDFTYAPAAITVAAGTTIGFTNEDDAPHTATSGTSPAPDGVFDSGTLAKGETKRIKLTKPGTLAYFCELHPFMKGTIIVR